MPLLRVLIRLLPWILVITVGIFIWRSFKDFFGTDEKETPAISVNYNTILTSVEELGKMELVRYNFKDVVEYKKEVSRYIPDSKVVLIVAGEAVGCVDFTKIQAGDIVFEGDSIVQIALPEPELCYYKVDHSQSKVFSKENTYFQDAELVEESFKYAENNVKRAALNSGILRQTTENAEKILKPMLEEITGKRVVLVPQRRIQNPELPRKL
ncbi:DUF4230 domain-containing protein [Pontibacter sp. BT310]|uniref:DUF4230 domain-containing protein n=1 Tax=Pontibacter populi TaxID=890055 RepID=A0ABS6XG81_9BACT|nr:MULTISPECIES: DUF4230 domain-containing protein [Pontibacter]MBJ6120147.1 DUF4230 domain-containing protein [Pontibacter sp. BT310]MBR0572580.1 DUF4230 domain-containing protein [Microvirga sp. STS03]MBW3367000.1 DUF4230 domain-containing protein [Pontibacter populi]